ncbi:DUF4124 domain-containing protein [Pseudomonas sp. No.21]|uniref:DUF4124 domain-containing protein n=1 Tax=Pseudomonas TaxID=286 RepID=UPI000DA866E4|nr:MULTISPECIES: DUF4124 domain-containing protein [Pseudomonas]MDW3715547.1 DUF4124 domain-containing protein [Pseudomonas sp. 2023EL-01195]PZE09606.1 DUF4124 domain-containing protein [Pseudomonas sp. 57B-090624]UXY54243.1 DUF4124 domain-containing protein [Pseudomonas tohonis]GJN45220.1 hypothetical protein TUM20249_12060 [Pseudomonas tohonis]
MRRLLLLVVLLPGLASAEIYRWTDASGKVHFSERPQAGAQQVQVKPQVVERDEATREREQRTEQFFDARRQEQAEAQRKAADARNQRQQQCGKLRSDLARLREGASFYRLDEKGERQYYSDGEIDAARRQLTAEISQHCG